MKKTVKMLTMLSAALLAAVLLIAGCEGPVGPQGESGTPGTPGADGKPGEDGTPGNDGEQGGSGAPATPGPGGGSGYPVFNSGKFGDDEWALLFKDNDKVQLLGTEPDAVKIKGTIPEGKTLEIAGTVTIGFSPGDLIIKGTVHILDAGSLVPAAPGNTYEVDGGNLQVDGKIFYSDALLNAEGTALKTGVTFKPGQGTVDIGDSADVSAVNAAFAALESVEWPTTSFSAAGITALSNWTGNKRLILSGANTPSGNLDVSAKGKLEIAAALTLNGAYTLKGSSSGAGNITVVEAGSIVLSHADAKLEGGIKVNGKISMGSFTLGTAIPATVDLSAGALASTAATANFTLVGSAWEIGALEVGGSLTITGATGLTVGTLKNTAAGTLTLPNIPVSVGLVETPTPAESKIITVTGAGDAAGSLTVGTVTGAAGLTLTAATVKVGTINIAAGSNITTTALTPFGTAADLASNKVTGAGTVDLGATALPIDTAYTFGAHIKTSGNVTLTASATFNQGLSAPVTNSGATTADVTLTLNGADSTLATLTSAGTGKKLILAGNGKVTVGGAVVATENLEVTSAGAVSFAVEAQTNTIATGKSLTVGNSSSVKAGQYLTFGPGKYTAGGANGFAYGNNILKALTNADGTLALGDAETGKLTLGGSDDVGNVTFTAATAVTLRGSGTGAIIVSAGGNLTLGTKADLKLGAGTVALGNAGKLTLGNGSIISGFTVAANGGTGLITTAQQGADASFKGTVDSVAYNSGVTPASTGAGYTKPSESGLITGSDTYTITGSADNGGVLTAASKVYQ